jgi:predicted DNA-binding ArsR family transcriptional regulator
MYQHQYKLLNDKFELIKVVHSFSAALKASKQYKALSGQFAIIVKHY